MAAIAFDPLAYAHALEEAGFTRAQAELVAQAGTAMFVQNLDAMVTRDVLDTRISESEARLRAYLVERDARFDLRFNELENRMERRFDEADARVTALEAKMDARFEQVEAAMDVRFKQVETAMDARFLEEGARVDLRFKDMEKHFARLYVIAGVIAAATVVPAIQKFFAWLG